MEERRKRGFGGFYYRMGHFALDHRWKVFAGSLLFLALGGFVGHQLKTQFFPDDVQYLSFMDVWLPNDVPLFVTNQTAVKVEDAVRAAAEKYGKRTSRQRRQASPDPEVAHHFRRRRRSALLVFRYAAASAAQLRPDHHRAV